MANKDVFLPYLFTGNDVPGIPLWYQPGYRKLEALSPGPILENGESPNWAAIKDKYDFFILGDERFFREPVPAQLRLLYRGSNYMIYKSARD